MPPKRVTMYTYGDDEHCNEISKLIEDAGVLLTVRDISKNPLSVNEVTKLCGHLSFSHFLNPLAKAYQKNKLDKELPTRDEVIKMISEDHTLLKRPIVVASRLLTVGCDKSKITAMLQAGRLEETTQRKHGRRVNA